MKSSALTSRRSKKTSAAVGGFLANSAAVSGRYQT
jgi:hypothetical protein